MSYNDGLDARAWLVRLRWLAVVGQLVLVLLAHYLAIAELRQEWLVAIIAAVAVSNLIVARFSQQLTSGMIGGILLFDVAALTALLYLSGGAANPFSLFYVVHVALAALLLGERWTWLVAALSSVLYGALFVFHVEVQELSAHHGGGAHHVGAGGGAFSLHLQGMWIAFALVAATLSFFFTRIIRAMERQAEALRDVRERAQKAERLAAVTALGATAAHELNSPLCTIKVIAGEMVEAFRRGAPREAMQADAELINSEVERCSRVLEKLRRASGDYEGEVWTAVPFAELVNDVRSALSEPQQARLEMAADARDVSLRVPRAAFQDALLALVRNGLEASEGSVLLSASRSGDLQQVTVSDSGKGMPSALVARLGEPFVTTKAAHSGLGLGVFLAKSLMERIKGTILYDSTEGRGTRVQIRVPVP